MATRAASKKTGDWTIELLEKGGLAYGVKLDGDLITRFEDGDAAEQYVKDQGGSAKAPSAASATEDADTAAE